jgi:hypothetical protein
MASPSNYTELQTEILSWLNRSDIASTQVQTFISLGESRLNNDLSVIDMENSTTVTLSASASTASLPSRFSIPLSLAYTDNYPIIQAAREEIEEARGASLTPGRPVYYAYGPSTIDFDRVANADYTLTLRYVKNLDIATDTTNSTLINHPGAYLWSSLAAAAMWLRDVEAMNIYEKYYGNEIKAINDADTDTRGRAKLHVDPALLRPAAPNIFRGY